MTQPPENPYPSQPYEPYGQPSAQPYQAPYTQPSAQPYQAPYSQPTANPYGQPSQPTGQPYPPQGGYGQPGYQVVPPPVYPRLADGTPLSPWGPTASWGTRAIALLWDVLFQWPAYIALLVAIVAFGIGTATAANSSEGPTGVFLTIGILAYIATFGLSLWRSITNLLLDQGRTGQTYGKRKQGIKLVREVDGQPIGAGSCFLRYLLGGVINYVVYLDYLWPLWDAKRQRLSDKLLGNVVVSVDQQTR